MADLVSVVIPVYNTNDRFTACFDSVLNQKYLNIEVILVDDGSCDTSAQLCDTIAALTINFPVTVIHKTNSGVSSARNLGIDSANGKYLVFIDSDDIVTQNYISDFIVTREKYLDVGQIWCTLDWSFKNVQDVGSDDEYISRVNLDSYYDLAEKLLTQSPCSRLYDVSIIRKNNVRMIENLSLGEDLIFNLEYFDVVPSKEICVINAANYIYLDDMDSLNNKYREDLEDINALILDKILQYTTKWGLNDSESIAKYYKIVYYRSVQNMQNVFNKKNKMPYYKKIIHNNHILRSDEFNISLSYMKTKIPNHLLRVYKTKNYLFVRIYDRFVKLYGWINEHHKQTGSYGTVNLM